MSDTPIRAFITNAGKYAEGSLTGEWVCFPTTPEHIQAVFARIGIDGKRYGEHFITCYESGIPGLAVCLGEHASLDELNYLASRIDEMDGGELEKFTAAIAYGENTGSIGDLINISLNLDAYELYPDISSERELGEYRAESDREAFADYVKMLKKSHDCGDRAFAGYVDALEGYMDHEAYGRDISLNESSRFVSSGYVVVTGHFDEIYDGEVPEEYRLSPYPVRPPAQKNPQKRRAAPSHGAL